VSKGRTTPFLKNGRTTFLLLLGNSRYGVTVIVTVLLVMLPIVALMFTLPLVVRPDTSVTTPAATVARLVLLEVQVATLVTSKEPLHVSASADRVSVVTLAVKGGALVGVT
jgi:hypothetical protein